MASSITVLPAHHAASVWWASFSYSPTHELWVAGRLTSLDTGESAWVEKEQPWEQCLPATLETIIETCQPPFQLKSQNRVVLWCNPARPVKHRNKQKVNTLQSVHLMAANTCRMFARPLIQPQVFSPKMVVSHQNEHLYVQPSSLRGAQAAQVLPKVPSG